MGCFLIQNTNKSSPIIVYFWLFAIISRTMGLEDGDWKLKRLSRRELFRGPFDHFRNESDPDDPKTHLHNKLVEGIGEGLSVAGILYVAWRGSQDQLVTYQVDSESRFKDLPQFPETITSLEQFNQAIAPISQQLNNLDKIWTGAYEDTVCNPVITTSTDSKGNTTTSTTIECHTEWNEPYKLTSVGFDHYKIENQKNYQNGLQNHIVDAESNVPQAFDLSNDGASLFYREKAADAGGQAILALAAYGMIGGLFCLYEEGISSASRGGYYDDRKPFIDDRKYIKRRTLLKLAAVGLMSWKMRDIQRAFIDDNGQLINKIKANTSQVLARLDVSPEENFKRFFGTDPKTIRNYLIDIRERSSAALNSGYSGFLDGDWGRVKPEIEKTNQHAVSAIGSFDKYFAFNEASGTYEIPAKLTTATKSLWGTREIINYANSQSSRIYTRHLTDALGMALGLGGIALVGEKLFFPLMDKVRESTGI